jgi:hypothetical protein
MNLFKGYHLGAAVPFINRTCEDLAVMVLDEEILSTTKG